MGAVKLLGKPNKLLGRDLRWTCVIGRFGRRWLLLNSLYRSLANKEQKKNTEWRRKDASKKIRSKLNKSFCGEKRFHVQIPDINDHQRHVMKKVRLRVE